MARARFFFVVICVLAVGFPSSAASTEPVGCSGSIPAEGSASCVTAFRIAHFTPDDAIDYDSLVARIVSPQAFSWRVHAKIADARGKVYFAWQCVARQSSVAANSSAYVDRSCEAWRKLAKSKHGKPASYYTADTSKPQTLTVTAWVGGCTPGCRFEAAAEYLLAG